MKTVSMRAQDVERVWWLIDAEGKTLGRLATEDLCLHLKSFVFLCLIQLH